VRGESFISPGSFERNENSNCSAKMPLIPGSTIDEGVQAVPSTAAIGVGHSKYNFLVHILFPS